MSVLLARRAFKIRTTLQVVDMTMPDGGDYILCEYNDGSSRRVDVRVFIHENKYTFKTEGPTCMIEVVSRAVTRIIDTPSGGAYTEREWRLARRTVLMAALWYMNTLEISYVNSFEECRWLTNVGKTLPERTNTYGWVRNSLQLWDRIDDEHTIS